MTSPIPLRRRILRILLRILAILTIGYLLLIVVVRPSNNRDWTPDTQRTASAIFSGDSVQVKNVRNAHYRSKSDYDVHWEDRSYDLNKLESVWFMVEPFSDWRGPAHTLLSFGFANGEYVAISVEIRKENGESFSPVGGLLRQYELIYIVGDEHDLIGLRANHRHDDVYLYKMRATPQQARGLFTSMLKRANEVAQHPEFYNTLASTCTTNIVEHINVMGPGRIPFSYKTLLPAYSDELAFDLGLIDTTLPREKFRAVHQINEMAKLHAESSDFSIAIRSHR
ncbi:MAG: DUF4105 domain-containing protein [Arenimonas sp.]